MRQILASVAAFLTLSVAHASAVNGSVKEPLDVPAAVTRLTTSTQLSGIVQAGTRLVAVGIRGLIITSDDAGATWTQRMAPVSSDLLAVHFPTAARGWAVGHDGVILHSANGGISWIKQFDGRQAATQLTSHFTKLADAGDENAKRLLGEMKLNYENGPEQALLDVWFEDEKNGFVCGSFGTLLATTDGGKTWESRIENIDYGTLLHLNAVRGVGGNVYLASEKGLVFRLDRQKKRFVPVETGYNGSFFSVAGAGNTVIAAGLRGSVYRSNDAGMSWEKLDAGLIAAVTGMASTEAGRILMVSQNGSVLISDDAGTRFTTLRVPRPTVLSGVTQVGSDKVIVVGLTGVQQVRLK